MKTYHFETKVSSTGTIQVPHLSGLTGREVKIIIIPKKQKTKKMRKPAELFRKWAGFLTNDEPEFAVNE